LPPTGVIVAVPAERAFIWRPVILATVGSELVRPVGSDWHVKVAVVDPPIRRLVPKSPNVPLGAGGADTVRDTGVLTAQLPPTGVIVTVPGATPVTT
jgi:hypothetical protein